MRKNAWSSCWCCVLVCVFGCATARSPSGPVAAEPSDAGAQQASTTAADSGAQGECRGPGRYESGKEGSYRPCCEGLTEVLVGKSAYTGTSSDPNARVPVCSRDLPLRVYACVRGTCGDGICEEEGEAPACSCVEDCPQAAFSWEDTTRLGQLFGVPDSCKQADLLARLLPNDAVDCGDLALDATQDERDTSMKCARDAFTSMKPFRVFWRTQGEDTIVHGGVIGRRDEQGRMQTFAVYVDGDAFGIDFQGATASWHTCRLSPTQLHCEEGPAGCLGCVPSYQLDVSCGCLPKGQRPGQPPGVSVELRCALYGT